MSSFEPMTFAGMRDGLACPHCGEVATWPDELGFFSDKGDFCDNCGIEGFVTLFDEEELKFVPEGRCERDGCPTCGEHRA